MTTFSDTQAALRMREFVKTVAVAQINKMRPEERVGKVYSYNPATQLAEIYFPGDDISALLVARFANDKIPTVSMIETYDQDGLEAAGDIVRIAGSQGAYYISDYVSGIPAVDPSARALVATNTTVLTEDIGVVSGDLANFSAQAAADIAQLNVDLGVLNDDIIVLNTSTLPALQADLGDAQLEIDALNNVTIPALNLDLATAQQDLDTLQTVTIPGLNSDIADLNTTLDNLDVGTIQADLDTLNTVTIPGLQSDLTQAQSDIASFQDTTDLHFSILLSNTGKINTLNNTTIPNLNAELDTAQADIAAMETDVGTLEGLFPITSTSISDGAITTPKMTVNTINGDRVTANTLNASKIVAGSITTDRMTANTINGDVITANTLNADRIVAGSIATDRMTANTILGDRIQANTLNADKIIAGSITSDRMTANTINGDRITANTLSATKIVAASITGDRIAANTITTTKLLVANLNNELEDPYLVQNDLRGWPSNNGWTIQTGTVGGPGSALIATGSGDHKYVINGANVATEPGEQWAVGARIQNQTTPSEGYLSIYGYDKENVYVGSVFTQKLPSVSWTDVSYSFTVPANVYRLLLRFEILALATGGQMWVTNPYLRRKNGGELIVDGAIITNHMTANTISGDRITANTLNADKVIAGTITTDRMTANTISGDRITANTLNASKIIAGTITTDRMTANTINADRMTVNTLNGDRIIANTINGDRIIANTIQGDRIVANTITSTQILAGAITADKLHADAITGKTINGGTITGTTYRSSSSNRRVQIDSGSSDVNVDFYNSSNVIIGFIDASDGGLVRVSGSGGLELYSGSGEVKSMGVFRAMGQSHHTSQANFSSWITQSHNSASVTMGERWTDGWAIHNNDTNRSLWQYSDGWWSTEGTSSIGCNFYGGFVAWSDMKDKSSLEPASSGLADIRKLPVFDYDTKHGGAGKGKGGKNALVRKRGVIAQDLQKVAPHLVIEDKVQPGEVNIEGEPRQPFGLGVDMYGLLSTAIAAIRELDEEVTQLKESMK